MFAWLRSIRLTWRQIALVAAASVLSTAVIVSATTGGRGLPYASLVALSQRVAVRRTASIAAPVPAASTPASATTPAPAFAAPATLAASAAADQAPASAPAPATTASNPAEAGASTATTAGTPTPGSDMSGSDTTAAGTTTGTTPASTVHPAAHVFVIALSTPSYRAAFGPGSVAHYLNGKLRRRGVLLSGYRTLSGSELPDYLAMVSGQAPNPDTRSDCPTYAEFASLATPLGNGQVPGAGCVYPNTVLTIADEVTGSGKQWRAYVADMGPTTCVHPDSGAAADGPLPGAGLGYALWHNPFVYFHSLLDLGGCSSNDVGLPYLARDLPTAKRTPSYAFIAPARCDEPAAGDCPGSDSSGLAAEDAFLKRWVPAITGSPAYQQDGVLMIVFAKAPAVASGPVRTGALILSAKAKAGSSVATQYNPYSVLRSAEDLLGVTPLVHAESAKSFARVALPGA